MKPKYKEGQWVRFYSAGNLIIGVIEYIRTGTIEIEYCTDQGTVSEKSILEAR